MEGKSGQNQNSPSNWIPYSTIKTVLLCLWLVILSGGLEQVMDFMTTWNITNYSYRLSFLGLLVVKCHIRVRLGYSIWENSLSSNEFHFQIEWRQFNLEKFENIERILSTQWNGCTWCNLTRSTLVLFNFFNYIPTES